MAQSQSNNQYLNDLIGQIGFGLYLNPNDKELKEYMDKITKIQKDLIL